MSSVVRRGNLVTRVIALALTWASIATAHPGHEHDDEAAPPATTKSAGEHVKITVRDGYRYVEADGIPDHETGQFPNRGNPNTIRPQRYSYRLPLEPKRSERGPFVGGWVFGVGLNGVPFDPLTAEFWRGNFNSGWRYEAIQKTINLGLDENRAHVQPSGAYHYHGLPTGLVELRRGTSKSKLVLLGYAADGFPIYTAYGRTKPDDPRSELKKLRSSYRLKTGTRPGGLAGPGGPYDGTFTADYEFAAGSGDLDAFNGYQGVTPEYPQGTYYYAITEEFPFIPRYFRGEPDPSFTHAAARGGRSGLGPPRRRPPLAPPR